MRTFANVFAGVLIALAAAASAAPPKVYSNHGGDSNHVVALKTNGSAWHWAGNGGPPTPTLVPRITGIVDISGGYALKADGTVWYIGKDAIVDTPTQVAGLSGITALAAGEYHLLALKSDGTVWAMGSNDNAQLGNGTAAYGNFGPQQVPGLGTVKLVSAFANTSLAVLQNGTVWVWGQDFGGNLAPGYSDYCLTSACLKVPRQVAGLANVTAALVGYVHVALTGSGAIYYWGSAAYPSVTPVPGVPPNVTAIATGRGHYVARTSAGEVWTWGDNVAGQLGHGVTGGSGATPAKVTALSNIAAVFAFYDCTMAMRADGQLFGWGDNTFGRLGDNTQLDRSLPTPTVGINGTAFFNLLGNNTASNPVSLTLAGPVSLVAGESATYAATAAFQNGLSKGVVPTWSTNNPTTKISRDGKLVTAAATGAASVSVNATYTEAGATVASTRIVAVSAGAGVARAAAISSGEGTHSLALRRDGTLVGWGENRLRQLGDATGINRSFPVQVNQISDVAQAVARDTTNIVLKRDGTVWIWGLNYDTVPQQVTALTNVARLATGSRSSSTFFIKNDTTLWEWAPYTTGVTAVGLSGVSRVSASTVSLYPDGRKSGHVLALKSNGTVFAWGNNAHGELGDGTRTDRATPQQVAGLTGVFIDVAAGGTFGSEHSLAVRSDGSVWAWGSRQLGAMGDGYIAECAWPPTTTCPAQLTAVQVPGLAGIKAVAIGTFHNLALKSDGTVWAWGMNLQGELGDGTSVTRGAPIQVPGITDAVAIAAGGGHSLALRSDGTVLAWGWNDYGQVGDGTLVGRSSPVLVLEAEGKGSIDNFDWFLHLDPTVAPSIPPALLPTQLTLAQASGIGSAVTLDATIKYRQADTGKRVNNYVLGLVPPGFFDVVPTAAGSATAKELRAKAGDTLVLAQLTPQGWTNVAGELIAYSSGVASGAGGGANILKGTALPPGSRFCVGYGESSGAMLTSQALREVLVQKGATGTATSVPCVITGVYVDGPPSSLQSTPATFTASVVGLSPTGSVQFRDGFGQLAAPVALTFANPAVARASITTSSLALGVHSVGATYPGDAQNAARTSDYPLLHVVLAPLAQTGVALAGPASSAFGNETRFTAIVTGNLPTGSVQFKMDGANLGAPVALVESVATLRTATLPVGTHAIGAAYLGDTGNGPGSAATIAHKVDEFISTEVRLASDANPSNVPTPVRFTATVVGTNPAGNVAFKDGAATFATVPLAGGSASITVNSLAPGVHSISAHYAGDASNPPASSETIFQRVQVVIDPALFLVDTDLDGMSNGVEAAEGRNPLVKDNDVFGNARLFAMQQYRDFLAREGDAAGIAAWSGNIASGAQTRGQVIESFFASSEFQGTIAPVARLYFAYFLRIPEYEGINFWIGYYRAGNSLEAISNFFASSPEFTSRYGSLDNAQFVTLVYNNVLGRAPDGPGLAFWKNQLDTGARTRGQVMLGFSESDEYRATSDSEIYVTMMYIGMLRRAPDAPGFSFWVQYRDDGNSGLALINGFLASTEYHNRFLP